MKFCGREPAGPLFWQLSQKGRDCLELPLTSCPKTWEAFPQLVTPVSHGAKVFKRFLLRLRKPHFAIFGSLVV